MGNGSPFCLPVFIPIRMNKETDKEVQDLSIFIDTLLSVFKPTTEAKQATHWFTTEEIHAQIKSINPGTFILLSNVYEAMIAAGFTYQQQPGSLSLNCKWMLIEKQ
ncbi:MAG: 5-formyltetrahydrofolate cyclo-ligase [Tannerellaceae bacterium]|nr:5-formyltetrahydrofolate cyclo-ligase [Tannerellaceae bacterium]